MPGGEPQGRPGGTGVERIRLAVWYEGGAAGEICGGPLGELLGTLAQVKVRCQ